MHRLLNRQNITSIPSALPKMVYIFPKTLYLLMAINHLPGEEHGKPLQSSCLENPDGERRWVGDSPWGHKELDMTATKQSFTILYQLHMSLFFVFALFFAVLISFFFFFFLRDWSFISKRHINFQDQNRYTTGFSSSQLVPKEITPKERTF